MNSEEQEVSTTGENEVSPNEVATEIEPTRIDPNLPPDRFSGEGALITKAGIPSTQRHWRTVDGGTLMTTDVEWRYDDGHVHTQRGNPPDGAERIDVNTFNRLAAEQQR